MSDLSRIRGSITALVTPFKDGEIEEESFLRLVEWQITEGTHGLVPVGTTGESPTLSHDEHHRVIELCLEAANGRVPVIAGTGSNSTAEAVSLTKEAERLGVEAALVVTPYYNKPSQEGLYAHYAAIHDATDVPIFIYNIPGRSVIDMSVETMTRLFELPRIVGVKDATGDLARVSLQRQAMGDEFIQLSGEDGTALGFMAHGGKGCISVSSNVMPAQCAAFQTACMKGDFEGALALQDQLMPLHSAMFCEPSPAPAKYGLMKRGFISDEVRSPLAKASDAARLRVDDAMRHAGY